MKNIFNDFIFICLCVCLPMCTCVEVRGHHHTGSHTGITLKPSGLADTAFTHWAILAGPKAEICKFNWIEIYFGFLVQINIETTNVILNFYSSNCIVSANCFNLTALRKLTNHIHSFEVHNFRTLFCQFSVWYSSTREKQLGIMNSQQ